ncbi:hypothetical protein D3C80_1977700 [compost metagenome]
MDLIFQVIDFGILPNEQTGYCHTEDYSKDIQQLLTYWQRRASRNDLGRFFVLR